MKILLVTHRFAPEVGGIQKNSGIIAGALSRRGHEVVLVTGTTSGTADELPYQVVRAPSSLRLLALHRWADVVLHNNVCVRFAWPLFLMRKPWIVTHHTWFARREGEWRMLEWMKHLALKRAFCEFAVSDVLMRPRAARQKKIGNAFNDGVIRHDPTIKRIHDLVFVGRLVSDKGVKVLLEGLGILRQNGSDCSLTIIGSGPDLDELKGLAQSLNLRGAVRFAGSVEGPALAAELSAHKVLVIPSTWKEPFGIVVIEAIACGCAVVGSDSGGIPEAMGPCGLTFKTGSSQDLAKVLARLMGSDELMDSLIANGPAHLKRYLSDNVALEYEETMKNAVGPASSTA